MRVASWFNKICHSIKTNISKYKNESQIKNVKKKGKKKRKNTKNKKRIKEKGTKKKQSKQKKNKKKGTRESKKSQEKKKKKESVSLFCFSYKKSKALVQFGTDPSNIFQLKSLRRRK